MTESGSARATMDTSAAMLAPLGIAGGAVYNATGRPRRTVDGVHPADPGCRAIPNLLGGRHPD